MVLKSEPINVPSQLYLCLRRSEECGNSGRPFNITYYVKLSVEKPKDPQNVLVKLVETNGTRLSLWNGEATLGRVEATIPRIPKTGKIDETDRIAYMFYGVLDERTLQARFKAAISNMVETDLRSFLQKEATGSHAFEQVCIVESII